MPGYQPILQNLLGGSRGPGGRKDWDPLMDVLGPEGYISMLMQSGRDAAGWDIGAQQRNLDQILAEIRKMGQYNRKQSMMPGSPGASASGGWR